MVDAGCCMWPMYSSLPFAFVGIAVGALYLVASVFVWMCVCFLKTVNVTSVVWCMRVCATKTDKMSLYLSIFPTMFSTTLSLGLSWCWRWWWCCYCCFLLTKCFENKLRTGQTHKTEQKQNSWRARNETKRHETRRWIRAKENTVWGDQDQENK